MITLVDRRVLELKAKNNQPEIAAQAGYVSQNMVVMNKQRRSKVALDRVQERQPKRVCR